MGKTLDYKIVFHTDWHCGAGLSAGADADALVVKDADGMPFVPGKTLKGLLREAMDVLYDAKGEAYDRLFGSLPDEEGSIMAEAFFSNAMLSVEEREAIKAIKAEKFLYRLVSATAIDDEGIACEGSLRRIQVVVPCVLYGSVTGVPEEMMDKLEMALGYIKRLGMNRSRGLGRCSFCKVESNESKGEKL